MATIVASGLLRTIGRVGTRARRGALCAVAVLALALLLGALTARPARAKTYTVNSTANPGNGICDAIQCTLSEAVNGANGNGQADTIAFASGLKGRIVLHNTVSQGGFSIYDDVLGRVLTIKGPGARALAEGSTARARLR
jgi:hypothetical protein